MLQIELPDQDHLMSDFGKMGVPVGTSTSPTWEIIDISETEEFVQLLQNCNTRLLAQKLWLFLNGEEKKMEEKSFGSISIPAGNVNLKSEDEEKRIHSNISLKVIPA